MREKRRFIDRVAAEAAELCAAVAQRDLQDLQSYVVPWSWLDGQQPPRGLCGAWGWTGIATDLRLESVLRQRGIWAGRGFACIVRDDRLFEASASPSAVRWGFLGIAIHELAHHLCYARSWFLDDEQLPLHLRIIPRRLRAIVAGDAGRPLDSAAPGAAPWEFHELDFVRAALHLVHRCRIRCCAIEPEYVQVAGPMYGLSPPSRYAFCLGSERFDNEDLAIREVLTLPAPAAFTGLFTADTKKG